MAMTMSGEATLPAARPRVWALLNDPEVLKNCIPGCQSLHRSGDNGFAAVAKLKIGPVSATFKGKVELTDIVPDVGYTISGEGEGGIAGFAKGAAKVALADAEGGATLLRYDVEAHVGGKIAQLGSRLIDGVAKGMADKFFTSFAEAAATGAAGATLAQAEAAAEHPAKSHVDHHFAESAETGVASAVAAAPRAAYAPQPIPASREQTAPPQPTPTKKSWFRRILEWFMSR